MVTTTFFFENKPAAQMTAPSISAKTTIKIENQNWFVTKVSLSLADGRWLQQVWCYMPEPQKPMEMWEIEGAYC